MFSISLPFFRRHYFNVKLWYYAHSIPGVRSRASKSNLFRVLVVCSALFMLFLLLLFLNMQLRISHKNISFLHLLLLLLPTKKKTTQQFGCGYSGFLYPLSFIGVYVLRIIRKVFLRSLFFG